MCFQLDVAIQHGNCLDYLITLKVINLNLSVTSKNSVTTETIDIAANLYFKIVTNVRHKCFPVSALFLFEYVHYTGKNH